MSPRALLAAAACAACLLAPAARGDLVSEMNDFFNDAVLSASTPPGLYQGQSGGMITGGAYAYRVPARTITPLSVQLPRLRAGCGGIDVFTGGFSYVDANELVSMLQNIGATAKAFAYQLALRIVSAQISATLSDVWTTAQRFLNRTISSCEASQRLVGGAVRLVAGQTAGCAAEKMLAAGMDYADAVRACQQASAPSAAPSGPVGRASSTLIGNLVYDRARAWYPTWDQQMLEVLMGMVGTVVVDPSGQSTEGALTVYPSLLLADGESWLRALLEGGQVTRWRCLNGPCTQLAVASTTVPQAAALRRRVAGLLQDMVQRIEADQPLTASETALLGATSLPVQRYLVAVRAAAPPPQARAEAGRIAELVARDLLHTFVSRILGLVRQAVDARSLSADDPAVQVWRAQAEEVEALVLRQSENVRKRFFAAVDLLKSLQVYERLLAAKLSAGAATAPAAAVLAGGRL